MKYKQLTKYRKGQTVILLNGEGFGAKVGATAFVTGRVKSIYGYNVEYVKLVWDRKNKFYGNQSDGGYFDKAFGLLYNDIPEGIDEVIVE